MMVQDASNRNQAPAEAVLGRRNYDTSFVSQVVAVGEEDANSAQII